MVASCRIHPSPPHPARTPLLACYSIPRWAVTANGTNCRTNCACDERKRNCEREDRTRRPRDQPKHKQLTANGWMNSRRWSGNWEEWNFLGFFSAVGKQNDFGLVCRELRNIEQTPRQTEWSECWSDGCTDGLATNRSDRDWYTLWWCRNAFPCIHHHINFN